MISFLSRSSISCLVKAWSSALNRRDLVATGFTLGCKLRNRREVGVLEAATLQAELSPSTESFSKPSVANTTFLCRFIGPLTEDNIGTKTLRPANLILDVTNPSDTVEAGSQRLTSLSQADREVLDRDVGRFPH